MMKIRVAVIGTGAAGICALRHLSEDLDLFTPVGFEINREVGGLWNYSDCTETDEYGLPCLSSCYKSLRINVPTAVMCFPDQNFPENVTSFPGYAEVKRYLDNYAKKFDLNKFIKFQTIVSHVRPVQSSNDHKWEVTSCHLVTKEVTTEMFDRVMVCNGKEGVPHIPDFPGMSKFQGTVIHAKNIRDVRDFKDKTILMVGKGYSSLDLMQELKLYVRKIYLAHRGKTSIPTILPENVTEVANIEKVLPDGALLEDGDYREVDVILLATGYHYSFPFLAKECQVSTQEERIQPLYNHMYHIEHPTLCFVGIMKCSLQFQVCYTQAQYICAEMRGEIILPIKSEMYKDEAEYYHRRVEAAGLPSKFAHCLEPAFHKIYVEKLAKESKRQPITDVALKLFDEYFRILNHEFGTLKKRTFSFTKDGDFEITI